MKTDELKIRNSSKKNITRSSKRAKQYDFLVKAGIKQDDIEFMSIFDTPLPLKNGETLSLGDYLINLNAANVELERKMTKLSSVYHKLLEKVEDFEERLIVEENTLMDGGY